MKTSVILVIIVIGELMGLFMVYKGIQKEKNQNNIQFELKQLFRNNSLSESSGIQLIIEGSFLIVAGISFFITWFFLWPA